MRITEHLKKITWFFLVPVCRFQYFRHLLQNPNLKLMSSFPNNHYWAYTFLIPWALAHKERGSKNFALGEKTLKRGHDYRKHQNGMIKKCLESMEKCKSRSEWQWNQCLSILGYLNKRGGKDGVFRGLAGLLWGISQGQIPREIPRSSPASPRKTLFILTLLLGLTFNLK